MCQVHHNNDLATQLPDPPATIWSKKKSNSTFFAEVQKNEL
jgi:hypothetical protein